MSDRKNALSWLVALSAVSAALGQVLMLSAAPHPLPMRRVPHVIARRLASSFHSHPPLTAPFHRTAAD